VAAWQQCRHCSVNVHQTRSSASDREHNVAATVTVWQELNQVNSLACSYCPVCLGVQDASRCVQAGVTGGCWSLCQVLNSKIDVCPCVHVCSQGLAVTSSHIESIVSGHHLPVSDSLPGLCPSRSHSNQPLGLCMHTLHFGYAM